MIDETKLVEEIERRKEVLNEATIKYGNSLFKIICNEGIFELESVLMWITALKPIRGKWIKIGDSYLEKCSVCHGTRPAYGAHLAYCPHCGAKMEVEDETL